MKGKLYLIPSTIGNTEVRDVIPEKVLNVINSIKYFIVENERTARRQLIAMGIRTKIDDLTFFVLDKHTDKNIIHSFIKPCEDQDVGLLSEAGVPAVADPGSEIVKLAHQNNIRIIPLVGPSSILMALMASGLNGQNFGFVGYLPIKRPERIKRIKELEQLSSGNHQTQIFIEAPYRNNQLIKDIIDSCDGRTLLCIACNISQEDEFIKTKSVADWKKNNVDFDKKPAIFLIHKY